MTLPRDPRLWQLAFQAGLLLAGALLRDFSLRWEQVVLTLAAALLVQSLWLRALRLARKGVVSAAITALGLALLLRADSLWVHPLCAVLAISSKFLIRVRGKHLFNPANLGVMLGVLLLPGAWFSPGQWGSDFAFAVWFVALGGLVTVRASRWDISWAFLLFYFVFTGVRALWLELPPAAWLHAANSGALLLFAFFMISDPMTTPDHRGARLLFAAVVAALAVYWTYGLFQPGGVLWALFLCAPLTPLLDRLLPAPRYAWPGRVTAGVAAAPPRHGVPPAGTGPAASGTGSAQG
jgi:Na+-transporting NADH:ubiquinone oxidoreductase subunit NqrB